MTSDGSGGRAVAGDGPASRPGGRSARVRRAVLDATIEHVAARGLDGLTVAAIAARAGVAHSTVYRRWRSPTDLVVAAFDDLAETVNPTPDTGALRTDLEVLGRQIAASLSSPGATRLIGAMGAVGDDDAIAKARDRFWRNRFEVSGMIVDRAAARGEVSRDADAYAIIEAVAAPIYFRVLVTARTVDDAFLARCVDAVVRSCASPDD